MIIKNINQYINKKFIFKGWIYNKRSSGNIIFLQLRDGTGFIQAVVEKNKVSKETWENANKLTIESSCTIQGIVTRHPKQDAYEIQTNDIKIIQITKNYPIGKKEHGTEFLFDNRDLYLRSKTPWAVLKIRNQIFLSITKFFEEENFIRFDTPILQPTSCEDTTQLFELKYYNTAMYLTQSGQLYSEAGIMSFGKVYDFGPVFRAEKSKTRNHLSEFWMMDAEMAFFDQKKNMDIQEKLIKRIVYDVLKENQVELKILNRDLTLLKKLVDENFIHLTHQEAKKLLEKDGLKVDYMDDMTTEEEIYIGNKFQIPVFIENYPFAVKAFYMKSYIENGTKFAINSDLIAPEEAREIIGGSQREENYNKLLEEIKAHNYPIKDYEWYLNTRKYGTVEHSGFGVGLERVVKWITGVHHIRETIPFPRTLTRHTP